MTHNPAPRASLDDLLSGTDPAGTARRARSPGPGPGDGPVTGDGPGTGDDPGTGDEAGGLGADFKIMPRPRRRITRLTAALALLAAAAAGFAGGCGGEERE